MDPKKDRYFEVSFNRADVLLRENRMRGIRYTAIGALGIVEGVVGWLAFGKALMEGDSETASVASLLAVAGSIGGPLLLKQGLKLLSSN